jgi:hypothetical protein
LVIGQAEKAEEKQKQKQKVPLPVPKSNWYSRYLVSPFLGLIFKFKPALELVVVGLDGVHHIKLKFGL